MTPQKNTDPSFEDLFDINKIQTIQDAFARATGVASIITDINGNPITQPSNFSRLCKNIIRKTEKGMANCIRSDAAIGRYNPGGPIVQTCLSGGLWDAGASISAGGEHIANWLIGQVRNEAVNEGMVLDYADVIGADKIEFKEALNEVNIMSLEQFKDISQSLFLVANQLSEQAYHKLQQKRLVAEKIAVQEQLNKKNIELQNTLKRVSEPYFTTKKRGKGTGLGLAAVHGIVKNLHGEIRVHTRPGKGSSFFVYLPKIIQTEKKENQKPSSTEQFNGNEHILVVDDENAVLIMVKQLLKRFGYTVTTFEASCDALTCFEASPHEFDLVITDMTMPGITGDKLVTKIKSIRPDIPVILCTGFSEKTMEEVTNGNRPDKVLIKPSGKDQILKTIRYLLDA